MRSHNLLEQRFGRLLVLSREPSRRNRTMWLCLCDCGANTVVAANPLVKGRTKSCGCYRRQVLSNLQHGMSGTRTHNIWRGMLKRCQTKTCGAYPHYGGRGIKVCDRWQTFENFFADMGEAPLGSSIEREDVNGDYEPSNCVWLELGRQTLNTRRTVHITIGEESNPLSVWCEKKGLRYGLVYDRIARLGWTPERALTEKSNA
jgi:hypothetical protein